MRTDAEPSAQTRYPWRVLWVLLIASVLGGMGVIPYIRTFFGAKMNGGSLSLASALTLVIQAMQFTLLFGVTIGIGLLLAPKVGIRTPLLDRWLYGKRAHPPFRWRAPIIAGVAVGLLVALGIYGFMAPRVSGWPSEVQVPAWMRVLAAIYAGVDEEPLMRLFLFALVLWLGQMMSRRRHPNAAVFWIANCIVALLFAAAYLPAAAIFVPLGPLVTVCVLAINTIAGVVFGYLCFYFGLEAAIVAGFIANLLAHFLGPLLAG